MLVLSVMEFIASICVSVFASQVTSHSDTEEIMYMNSQPPFYVATTHPAATQQNTSEMELIEDLSAAPAQGLVEEFKKVFEILLHLAKGAAHSSGRSIASLWMAQRHLWLAQLKLPKQDRSRLMELPLTPGVAFGPGAADMLRRAKESRESKKEWEQLLPRPPPPKQNRPDKGYSASTMANSVPPANGFVVVSHMYPPQQGQGQAHQQGGQPVSAPATSTTSQLGKFLQRDPSALGYIIAGSLTVRANKDLNSCLVKGSLGMNVVCTVVAGTAVILHGLEFIFTDVYQNCYPPYPNPSDSYTCRMHVGWVQGSNGVMLVLSLLELILSICITTFACKSTCICCSDTEPVAYFIPNPMTMAQHTAPMNTSQVPVGLPSGAPYKPADQPPIYTEMTQ
ncbi:uncharacterized protein LOC134448817 [Engraulis encrasicolus]|uniref:uncharacterized protein LOC134448817 n=1 Tax=Engraulis encrasicolus TaxID=184585 RepID=UPI002FD10DAD